MDAPFLIITGLLTVLCMLLLIIILLLSRQIRRLSSFVETLQDVDSRIEIPAEFTAPSVIRLVDGINKMSKNYHSELDELRRKDETIKETITNLAHDVRTPLTSIEGYAKLLQESPQLTDANRESVATILERTDTLKRLLNQLFDFARLDSDTFEYHEAALDLNELLKRTAVSFYSAFEAKRQEPCFEIAEEPFPCVGDPDAVTRVFSNILFNALRHGNSDYRISSEKSGSDYVFRFQNDAGDITEADLPRLFDRFYTTDHSRTKKTTGLGLSIAQKIVTHMGGRIYAELADGLFSIVIRIPTPEA